VEGRRGLGPGSGRRAGGLGIGLAREAVVAGPLVRSVHDLTAGTEFSTRSGVACRRKSVRTSAGCVMLSAT
jgi:hypothetical protein